MLPRFKHLCWAACLMAAVHSASAFSFVGITEPYQVAALGYTVFPWDAPHNLGEEFRWNVPVLYYTVDQTFLDYFGTNGVAAVDAGFKVFNDTLSTNVSSWSPGLDEFPLESMQLNYTASALHLFDVKSCMLEIMMKELCLADPVAYTWTLRNSAPGAVTGSLIYGVIQRNFDPATWEPSAYVNGILYTYWIDLTTAGAITVPVSVDPMAFTSSPVAAPKSLYAEGAYYGYYYTGLTRDDVGGLRYLLCTNNLILENAGSGTLTSVTNTAPELLYTSNLTDLAYLALTNTDAQLAALYPGLFFSTPATNFPVLITNTIVTSNYVKSPYSPYTNGPTLVLHTNYSLAVQLEYVHFFGNLQVVQFTNGAWTNFPVTTITNFVGPNIATLQTVSINPTNAPDGPYGVANLSTNVTEQNFVTNQVVGEFFVLTSNYCNMLIVANELTETNSETNVLFGTTNVVTLTNTTGTTNTAGAGGLGGTNGLTITNIFAQNLVSHSTNHVFLAYPVTCQAAHASLREGINRMQFVRRDYDSLLNRFWEPITNTFTVAAITNNATYPETISRVVTAPDIVVSAADLAGPSANPPQASLSAQISALTFDTTGIVSSPLDPTYGPGTVTLQPQGVTTLSFVFNKVGPLDINFGPITVDQATSTPGFLWASFDGTTNFPVIYPLSLSLTNLLGDVIMQTLPAALPSGSVGVPYASTFSGVGGQAPYSFALAAGSILPSGLVLANGVLSGTPGAAGSYAFTIQMTDAGQRFIDTPYAITINP
jgi:hypothetical protein